MLSRRTHAKLIDTYMLYRKGLIRNTDLKDHTDNEYECLCVFHSLWNLRNAIKINVRKQRAVQFTFNDNDNPFSWENIRLEWGGLGPRRTSCIRKNKTQKFSFSQANWKYMYIIISSFRRYKYLVQWTHSGIIFFFMFLQTEKLTRKPISTCTPSSLKMIYKKMKRRDGRTVKKNFLSPETQ